MQNQNSWKVEDTLFPVKEVPAIWNNEFAQVYSKRRYWRCNQLCN
jgi:hypothetical protein